MRTQERLNGAQGWGRAWGHTHQLSPGPREEREKWTERYERKKKEIEVRRDRGKQRERHKVTAEEIPK